jgi:hypothetical protein
MDTGFGRVVPNAASTVTAVGQLSPEPVVRALGTGTGVASFAATVGAEVGAEVEAEVGAAVGAAVGADEAVEPAQAARLTARTIAVVAKERLLLHDTEDASFQRRSRRETRWLVRMTIPLAARIGGRLQDLCEALIL